MAHMATTVLAQTPTLNLPMPLTGLWRHATHATHKHTLTFRKKGGKQMNLCIKAKPYNLKVTRTIQSHSLPLTAYLFPSGLPRKLAQYTPDYFLVVDSGATVHVLWVSICTAYTKESCLSPTFKANSDRQIP